VRRQLSQIFDPARNRELNNMQKRIDEFRAELERKNISEIDRVRQLRAMIDTEIPGYHALQIEFNALYRGMFETMYPQKVRKKEL
jgi:hypothetical protein